MSEEENNNSRRSFSLSSVRDRISNTREDISEFRSRDVDRNSITNKDSESL